MCDSLKVCVFNEAFFASAVNRRNFVRNEINKLQLKAHLSASPLNPRLIKTIPPPSDLCCGFWKFADIDAPHSTDKGGYRGTIVLGPTRGDGINGRR